MRVVHRVDEMVATSRALRAAGRPVALVPTMGALHDGHLSLIAAAIERGFEVVVSIFVNPLQFGPSEDFDRYPRTLAVDLHLLRGTGTRVVFAPTAGEMYPNGRRTTVRPGPTGSRLCGATRPQLFGGMLTVVAKLLLITRPDAAFFGEKDYQQLVLIREMVADLDMGIEIVGVPTVREADGLAMSSRNRYLSARERAVAVALPAALTAGVRAGAEGGDAVLAAAALLSADPGVAVEYLELRDPELGPAPAHGDARLLVAARVGATRLIDNMAVQLPPSTPPTSTGA
ncbi:pantoate--beta-alanine ligase [Nocardia otitidiscaviarum]|uniref:pantoate--beta-alanine ligase n=1 Tax=Nocardia otitidiscaviarum TaxID=1823 RepID=UPI002B4ABA03|nr:pantoate--beta-alanine ligase [Nocardia otitidiscaviarum]